MELNVYQRTFTAEPEKFSDSISAQHHNNKNDTRIVTNECGMMNSAALHATCVVHQGNGRHVNNTVDGGKSHFSRFKPPSRTHRFVYVYVCVICIQSWFLLRSVFLFVCFSLVAGGSCLPCLQYVRFVWCVVVVVAAIFHSSVLATFTSIISIDFLSPHH